MHSVQEPEDRPLVSVTEAAVLAGLSKSVAYRLASAGGLPGLVRLPGVRLLVRRRVLEAWLSGAEIATPGDGAEAPTLLQAGAHDTPTYPQAMRSAGRSRGRSADLEANGVDRPLGYRDSQHPKQWQRPPRR